MEECTDAKGLSIGISQWSDDELAGKVWRNTKNRWSRQSEELPLNRILDLAILTCKTIQLSENKENNQAKSFNSQEKKQLKIDINEEATKRDLKYLHDNFSKYTKEEDKIIYPRLKELKKTLDEIV